MESIQFIFSYTQLFIVNYSAGIEVAIDEEGCWLDTSTRPVADPKYLLVAASHRQLVDLSRSINNLVRSLPMRALKMPSCTLYAFHSGRHLYFTVKSVSFADERRTTFAVSGPVTSILSQ